MSLAAGYDGVLLDLDGTAYRGRQAVAGAVDSVEALRESGRPVGFVTNNASRSPVEVAAHLEAIGFPTDPEHVVTSAQAGAALLAERLAAGDAVLVVGTESLAAEVRAVGLVAVRGSDAGPIAVVQGHSPDTCWADLAEACLALRAGALWVACNVDPSLPTERGELPGNGSMVAALRTATRREPLVAGKPERRLLDQAAIRLGMRRPLVVGDRLDTDIAGATAAGMDAMLVLTGVSSAADLLAAAPHCRPRFVAADLTALHAPADRSLITDRAGWDVELDGATATLAYRGTRGTGDRDGGPDHVTALQGLCAAWWASHPAGAAVAGPDTVSDPDTEAGPLRVLAVDGAGRAAVAALGLA